jgi:predicted PolB exonuclease-like 3'-5' exonuclease
MTEKRYLVLDIETILDLSLVRTIFNLDESATEEDVKQQLYAKYTSGFAPPPFHIPICIALIDVDFENCRVQNATVLEDTDEKKLLQKFWKVTKFRKGSPILTTLVSFNGRSFDLPCLFLRSLKHRVPILPWDRNRYAFEKDTGLLEMQKPVSHDVCDDLSEFGASGRVSLDLICKLLGLPGKTETRGYMVEELYRKGEMRRITDYCMEDALNTYMIWVTLKYVRGQINEEKYLDSFNSAEETVRNCRARIEAATTSQDPPTQEEPPDTTNP